MKQVILLAVGVFGISVAVSAQRVNSRSYNTTLSMNDSTEQGRISAREEKLNRSEINRLDNRKIYHWNNGQRATPTGEEATSSNDNSYSALRKDPIPAKTSN